MGESHLAALMATTMATRGPEGNRRPGLFPRLLLRLKGFCSGYAGVCVAAGKKTFRPRLGQPNGDDRRHETARINQLLSSDLIRLSNSSNEVSPLIISPLMKKVGVELTFSTSLANF